MGRIGRSIHLVGQSYRLLMQDKELMLLPLCSGVIIAAVALSFFLAFGIDERLVARHTWYYVPMFLLYVATYTVGIFFQAAVVAGATERMRGGSPTFGSAIAAAGRRLRPIVLWAVVAATVGTVLRAVQDRAGFVGKIVVGLLGAAWSLATFFVVPVLVLEDLPVQDSFKRSVAVFKQTWGETMIGSASVGIIAVCAWVTLVAVVGLLAWAGAGVLAFGVGAVGAILLVIGFSALQGIYVASLYHFATAGAVPPGFDRAALAGAFQRR